MVFSMEMLQREEIAKEGSYLFVRTLQKKSEIAVQTVREYKRKTESKIKVVFNVFKDIDKEIYRKLLTEN